ncbi:TetR/AcrR family transcriptional regulator [Prauserella muralis]|uniref:TetR family transcriptional regulator n=1 Tax=Prauserella muralis TaxID=588067 RepID=A0A2V4AHE3_9PSEU|nr:TetR/AcrR family transcriptional regulator [Prauserella muralis]PXY18970.1 TetR family transcriptional regulator [Prauserella muralis]
MARQTHGSNGKGSAALRPKVTDAIVEAVLAELAERGFLGMSMDGVARRAGVGKSALYRRWPSKVEMTADVLSTLSVTEEPAADTGSLEQDVRALLDDILNWLSAPQVRRIYPDLLAEAQRNPMLAEALMDHIGNPRRLRAQAVLDRAAARGELAGNADQDLILDVFGSLIFWRMIALSRPVTPSYLDKVASLILHLARGGTDIAALEPADTDSC